MPVSYGPGARRTRTCKIPATEFRAVLLECAGEHGLSQADAEKLAATAKPGFTFTPGAYKDEAGNCCPVMRAFEPEDGNVNALPERAVLVAHEIDAHLPHEARLVVLV